MKPVSNKQDTESLFRRELSNLVPQLKFVSLDSETYRENLRFDLVAEVTTKTGTNKILLAEVISIAEPRLIRSKVLRIKEYVERIDREIYYPVICSKEYGERALTICKENGIGYIDLAGNFYLEFDDIYLEKVVAKKPYRGKRKVKNVFRGKSSRILRVLLDNPKREWKIPQLASESKISVGLAYKVVRSLYDQEYILQTSKKKIIVEKATELLDDWRDNYSFNWNKAASYFVSERNIQSTLTKIDVLSETSKFNYALSMLVGAQFIAPYVRSKDIYVYVDEDIQLLKDLLELKDIEFGGNIHLVIPYDNGVFYGVQKKDSTKIVSNIQLYLDLYNYPSRGREQADFLREKAIKF